MTDLLDSPEFEARLRDTMTSLAEKGVPSVTSVLRADLHDVDVQLVAEPQASAPRIARRRVLIGVGAALVGIVAVVSVLMSGDRDSAENDVVNTPERLDGQPGWRVLPPAPIQSRADAASAWTGDRWIVWGGSQIVGGDTPVSGVTQLFRDGAAYNPGTNQWMKIADSPLEHRRDAHAVVLEGEVAIIGGEGPEGRPAEDAAIYDPTDDEWRAMPPPPGTVVDAISTVERTTGEPVLLALLQGASDELSISMYQPDVARWNDPVLTGRNGASGTLIDAETFVFLELDGSIFEFDDLSSPPQPLTALNDQIPESDALATFGFEQGFVVVAIDGPSRATRATVSAHLFIAGADIIETLDFGDREFPTESIWTSHGLISIHPEPARWGVGRDDDNFGAREPTALPSAPIDLRRAGLAVGWTGSEVLVWGGESAAGPLGASTAGAALDPVGFADPAGSSWTAMAPSPLSPREEHASVWTGEEMIIFGGRNSTGGEALTLNGGDQGVRGSSNQSGDTLTGLRDGAAYDPATDTWRALPDAPFGITYQHRAVWTGTEMIVVGRNNAGIDAWSFDPTPFEENWRELEPPDIPGSIREIAMAGSTAFIASANDGAWLTTYDAEADKWSAPSSPGGRITALDNLATVSGTIFGVAELNFAAQSQFFSTTTESGISFLSPISWDGDLGANQLVPGPHDKWIHWFSIGRDGEIRIWRFIVDGDQMILPGAEDWASQTLSAPYRSRIDFDHLAQPAPVATDGGAFILVGNLDETIILQPGDDRWRSTGQPESFPQFGHASVWTGTELLVWGGRANENGGGSIATGLRFRPN